VFARFSTFNAQTSAIDAGIAYVRDDVMTAMQHIDGFIGLSTLVDRSTGRCVVTSAWRDQEAMRASASRADQLRSRGSEILGATAAVEEYEIALMHRAHRSIAGERVRGTWAHGDTGMIDDMIATYRMTTLPAIEDLRGFAAATLFVNRETGQICSSVAYDSLDDMVATRGDANGIRTRTLTDMGATLDEVCEFELAMARFHVPEMV
jgi:heme-degrading monooxygenase HmoA